MSWMPEGSNYSHRGCIMLDRNNVGCEKLLPVHVPSTKPNGMQSRKLGHKQNANRKLDHETHIISVKYDHYHIDRRCINIRT